MSVTLHTVEETTSTNDLARQGLLDGVAVGTTYRADRQLAGRGRHGRPWHSEPGNLMMSVVLRPRLVADRLPMLTLVVAVAVRRVLAHRGLECGLRWPNDLIAPDDDDRKLGGILVEGVFDGDALSGCVVGVGINVALDVTQLEEPLRSTATSMAALGVPLPDLDELAEWLALAIVDAAERLEAEGPDELLEEWREHNVILGRPVRFELGGLAQTGRAVDLDERGALVVEMDDGHRQRVTSGRVEVLAESESTGGLLLVLDVGNTNTVAGVFDGKRLVEHWRLGTHRERTADEHGVALIQLLSVGGLAVADIAHVMLSCVVPPMLSRLEEMAQRFFKTSPHIVGPGTRTGMPILYENPREVGADRVVNAVGAYARHRGGLIVVDFGTATTFDAVSPRGEYLGGVIAPGIAISADALFRRAAMLPRVDLARPPRVVGRNTVVSMQAGLVYGYVGLVGEIVRRMKQELGFAVRVLATGGLASLIAAESTVIDEVDEHLTLNGLRILFELNTPRDEG